MSDLNVPKGTVPKGQWNNQERPLTLRKNFKYGAVPQRDDMKYKPGQILFVKNVPQYTASNIAGLFTQYKPLDVKNFYPDSAITTFMIALPNADVARMALDVLNGLRVDNTIITVEPYNANQSTVARREVRRKRNEYGNIDDHGGDCYEADGEVRQDSPATEEGVGSNALKNSVTAPARKVTNGVSWANIAQGKADDRPSPSPSTPQAIVTPKTVTEPSSEHLQQPTPSVQELIAAFDKSTPVDRSTQFPTLTQESESDPTIPHASSASKIEHKNEDDIGIVNDAYRPQLPDPEVRSKPWYPPLMRVTFTSPSTASADFATTKEAVSPLRGIPMSKPYPGEPLSFTSDRTRLPPPGLGLPPGLPGFPAGLEPSASRSEHRPSATAYDSPMAPFHLENPQAVTTERTHPPPPGFLSPFGLGIPARTSSPEATVSGLPANSTPGPSQPVHGASTPTCESHVASPAQRQPLSFGTVDRGRHRSAAIHTAQLEKRATGFAPTTVAPFESAKGTLGPLPPESQPLLGSPFASPPPPVEFAKAFLESLPPLRTGYSAPTKAEFIPPPGLPRPPPGFHGPPPSLSSLPFGLNSLSAGPAGPPPHTSGPSQGLTAHTLGSGPAPPPGLGGVRPGPSSPPPGFSGTPQINITPATASLQLHRSLTPPAERFKKRAEFFFGSPQPRAWAQVRGQSSESSRVEQDSSQVTPRPNRFGQISSQNQQGPIAMHTNTTEYIRHEHCKGCWFCQRREGSTDKQSGNTDRLVDY